MIEAERVLSEIRGGLQAPPGEKAIISTRKLLLGLEEEYIPGLLGRKIFTPDYVFQYRKKAASIANTINREHDSTLIDVNATIGKGEWFSNEIPHLHTHLARFGRAWQRGADAELIASRPNECTDDMGIYFSAEFLVSSALMRWSPTARNRGSHDPPLFLSAYEIGEYRTTAQGVPPSFFQKILEILKSEKGLILPSIDFVISNSVRMDKFPTQKEAVRTMISSPVE